MNRMPIPSRVGTDRVWRRFLGGLGCVRVAGSLVLGRPRGVVPLAIR
ncbi:hypothetical protein A2U01_0094254, partial [Trifolium medium]|nr:hypothetical protein [Trifolium medium]